MEALREAFGGGTRPPFLGAGKNPNLTVVGKFLRLVKYTAPSLKEITCVEFEESTGKVWLIATFTLRVKEGSPTGEALFNKPVMLKSDGQNWRCDLV